MNHQQKHDVGEIFLRFIRRQVLTGEFNFDDGRSAVVHVLDAFYRAEAQLNNFRRVFDTCCNEIASRDDLELGTQVKCNIVEYRAAFVTIWCRMFLPF